MGSIRDLIQHVRPSRKGAERVLEANAVPGSDLLTRLPVELHIMLLQYLEQGDVVVALNASKTLRRFWLSEDVWPLLAERWHPGLSQALRAAASRLTTTSHEMKGASTGAPAMSEIFRLCLRRISIRTSGRYASMLHHRLQLVEDPLFSLSKSVSLDAGGMHSWEDLGDEMLEAIKRPDHVARFMVYSHGRIAWWPDTWAAPYIAVVDDLRTTQRRIYRFPEHGGVKRGYKTAMSDQLLVLGREKMLHAWHLKEDVLASVVIPDHFERCIAEGPTVLVVTRFSEVYRWIFGGRLERMPFGSLGCYRPGPIRIGGLVEDPYRTPNPAFVPRRQGLLLKDSDMLVDFIIHPSQEDVYFVVSLHNGHLIVYEIDHGRLVQSYPVHDGTTSSTEKWKHINEYLRWENCDSYGGYRLLSVYLGGTDELAPADLQRPGEECCAKGSHACVVSVCFNIYTKTFKVQCHHAVHQHRIDNPLPVFATFHLWDNKLYTSYPSEFMQAGMPITALRPCPPSSDTQSRSSPTYTTSEMSRGILARRAAAFPERLLHGYPALPQTTKGTEIDFSLDVTMQYATKSNSPRATTLWSWDGHHVHQTIAGDDDFLVYVVDGVYMVWSFGDEIPAPKNGAGKWAPWRRAQSKTN